MTQLRPTEAFEIFLAAMERQDIDTFFAMLDDDVELRFPYMPSGYPKQCTGRAEAENFLTIIPKLFREFRWIEPTIYATSDPELAMTLTRSKATLNDGTSYENDYVLFLRVRDGKVIEYREIFDPARALAAFQSIAA